MIIIFDLIAIPYLCINQYAIELLSSLTIQGQNSMRYHEQQFSSDSSDSNFELESKRKSKSTKNKNFQKNFPKNILTSLILCLDHMGYQEVYLDGGISGQEIQRRNSASLNNIHMILTHPLMNPFNKHQFELLASNILLQNSKISKKAFHLTLLREVFSFPLNISLPQFKLEMRKRARSNSLKDHSNLEIFQSQSSTIYLLTIFGKVMDGYPNFNDGASQNRESTQEELNFFLNTHNDCAKKQKKNREVLKPSIKDLSVKLNKISWEKSRFCDFYDSMRNLILNTQEKIAQELSLKRGVPYLRLFCPEVVSACFQKLKNGQKITISNLEAWVKQFERKSLDCIAESVDSLIFPVQDLFKTQIKQKDSIQVFNRKIAQNFFSPIILTHPN